jgi:mono/diheme cytochrome c family protein
MPPAHRATRLLRAFTLGAAILAGCEGPVAPAEPTCEPDTASRVTYEGTVRAFLETTCVTCHRAGGLAPFSFESWPVVQVLASKIVDAVEEGHMPPAQTDPACRVMESQRYVSDPQRALLHAWRDAGYPKGDECAYVAPPPRPEETSRPAPSIELQVAEPLQLSDEQYDDFRWVELDHVFAEDVYVVASEFVSDIPSMVHHASIMVVDPDDSASSVGATPLIGGQLPGMNVFEPPEGSAMWIPAGSSLGIDLHYHVHAHEGDDHPVTDQPRVRLWTLPPGETPTLISESLVLTAVGFVIPAGEPDALIRETFTLPSPSSAVWALLPHMHQRGVALRAELIRPDGSRECVIDVVNFDFRWQLIHRLPADGYLAIGPGDVLQLDCHYDNSPENQPVVDGVQLPAEDVYEGGESLQEMCQLQLLRVRPL